MCCFLNFYGRTISTVIILVKNTSISWVCDERLVGLVYFDHAINWLHFGHWNMFLVPSKCCRWRTKQKKKHYSIVQWFCVIFRCCIFLSISAWSDANPVTYSEFLGFCRFCNWKLMSCSIIEFAVNHRQTHCLAESPEILYFCNIYTTRTHRILFFFPVITFLLFVPSVVFDYGAVLLRSHGIYSIAVHQTYGIATPLDWLDDILYT